MRTRTTSIRRHLGALFVCVLAAACAASPARSPSAAPPTVSLASGTPEPLAPALDESWEKIREEDGITVHRREVPGSPLVAFRGEGDVDASLATVALVQMDLAHVPEWVDSVVEARVLEQRSDTEYVTYSHVKAPPLVSDRDFVNHVEIEFAAPDRVTFRLSATDAATAPVTDYVRGVLMGSSFTLTAAGPSRTHIVCEIHADPKGSLPKWVVNLFQKGWAFKTITSLRAQVKRPGVVSQAPGPREILARHGFAL